MTRFRTEWRVGWPDVDLVGIVYFPRFLGYFEHAELEWVRSHGMKYSGLLEKLDIWMPRAAAHCNYHAPARLDDLLRIEMYVSRLGKTSFTLSFEVFRKPEEPSAHLPLGVGPQRLIQGETRLADGYIVIATVSRETFRPLPIPKDLRAMLATLEDRDSSAAAPTPP